MMGYRSSVHRTLGEAPFTMMFGRLCRPPIDPLIGPPIEVEYGIMSPSECTQNLTEAMKAAHDVVSAHAGEKICVPKTKPMTVT